MAAWRFVHVEKALSEKIREKHALKKKGFGSIPVIVKIGKTNWKTSMFPEKRADTYLLPLKAAIRHAEDIGDDDTEARRSDLHIYGGRTSIFIAFEIARHCETYRHNRCI